MKRLNEKGISIVEIIVTFSLIMIIVIGLLSIIMNYRQRMGIELQRMELVTYKDTLTKEIQTDIIDRGLATINKEGLCLNNDNLYDDCVNLVFKNGTEKILATSKTDADSIEDLIDLLNNKYIKYGDTRYPIEDKLPSKYPQGANLEETKNILKDLQQIYMNGKDFLSVDTAVLADGSTIKIYSIDIYMEHIDFEDDYGIHIVTTDNDTLTANYLVQDFNYTGDVQTYTIPANGTYKIEAWGASGSDIDSFKGGLGAYTKGLTYFTKGTVLYLYVGGSGENGGFNSGSVIASSSYGNAGGGASDIRLVGGASDNFDSLKSRIMVAAGGGSANNRNTTSDSDKVLYGSGNGGAGGGLTGYSGTAINYKATSSYSSYNNYGIGLGGNQASGGILESRDSTDNILQSISNGDFGKTKDFAYESGAGGGWFTGANSFNGGAGGGSSYISGHDGCIAIDQSSQVDNISMLPSSEYENYHFTDTEIIDGEGYSWTTEKGPMVSMPLYEGKTGENGNKGDGHITITYLGV